MPRLLGFCWLRGDSTTVSPTNAAADTTALAVSDISDSCDDDDDDDKPVLLSLLRPSSVVARSSYTYSCPSSSILVVVVVVVVVLVVIVVVVFDADSTAFISESEHTKRKSLWPCQQSSMDFWGMTRRGERFVTSFGTHS